MASTPPAPYGGDGPTDDYSAVRLTHKNAIWQKPASFTDEAPPPDAQWLMTAFLKVGGWGGPPWGAESCRGGGAKQHDVGFAVVYLHKRLRSDCR